MVSCSSLDRPSPELASWLPSTDLEATACVIHLTPNLVSSDFTHVVDNIYVLVSKHYLHQMYPLHMPYDCAIHGAGAILGYDALRFREPTTSSRRWACCSHEESLNSSAIHCRHTGTHD